MIHLLLILVLLPQQLTWYESYERGEKSYEKGEYQACIDDMKAALKQQKEAKRNLFTRAMMKIDYNPHYYIALSEHKLGHLVQAFEQAQKAYAGEVVRESPLQQSELAPILVDWQRQAEITHRQYLAEQAITSHRAQMMRLLEAGDLAEVGRLLDKESDKKPFEDIRIQWDIRQKLAAQTETFHKDLSQRIQKLFAEKDYDSADAVFDMAKNDLPADLRQTLTNLLAGPRTPRVVQAPTTSGKDKEESKKTKEEIEAYRNTLAQMEAQTQDLRSELASMTESNAKLATELAQGRTQTPPPVHFAIVPLLSLEKLPNRQVRLLAQAFSPTPITSWELRVNGDAVALPSPGQPEGIRYSTEHLLDTLGYGKHTFSLHTRDSAGQEAIATQTITFDRPVYLNPLIWAALLVLIGIVLTSLAHLSHKRRRSAKLRHFNPYIAGSPVRTQEMFYGRDGLIVRIQGLVHKNSFMIHGARRIGKTSLLLQLKSNLAALQSDEYRFFPAFIDLQGVHEEDLFHHIMAELLVSASDWELPVEELVFREGDQETYLARQFSKDLKKIIGFLQSVHKPHVQVVLLMDEVDVLNEFTEKTNQKLRGIFMKDFAEHLSCVMAGIHLKKEWDSAGSPWYNFFEQIPVDAFAPVDARRLILDPVKGIFTYQKEAVDLILDHTDNHPYLIQKVCVSLIGEKLKSGNFKVTLADATLALENLKEEIQRNRNELHHQSLGQR